MAHQVIKAVLIDLSGTLHVEKMAVPGAVDSLKRLRNCGVSVRFLTNTTKESKNVLHEKLLQCGFAIEKNEIFTSLSAACLYVQKKNLSPLLLLEEEALEDFKPVMGNQGDEKNAVVVGLAPNKFNYEALNEAFRYLLDGAELIAIHKGRYYSRGDGLALGPGPFVSALEFATGKTSVVLGKPEKHFFLSALEGLNVQPRECVMIGDDVLDDIEGALKAGFQGILVRTGKYRSGDEERSSIPPTTVCDSFPEAVRYIIERVCKIE